MKKKLAFIVPLLILTPLIALAQYSVYEHIVGCGINTVPKFIKALLGIVIKVGIPVASVFLIWAGFLFITAQGNESKLASAKKTFIWAGIGFGVLIASWLFSIAMETVITSFSGGQVQDATLDPCSAPNPVLGTTNPPPPVPVIIGRALGPIIAPVVTLSAPTQVLAQAVPNTPNQVLISWNPSTSPNITGYNVYQNGNLVGTTAGTSFQVSVVNANLGYSYTVSAVGSDGSVSPLSAPLSTSLSSLPGAPASSPIVDPTIPKLTATVNGQDVTLSWTHVAGATGYTLTRNGTALTTTGTTYLDAGLSPGAYVYTVATIIGGKLGKASAGVYVFLQGTGAGNDDLITPTIPTNLVATPISSTQIDLKWTASTDASGFVAYKIYRDGVQIGYSVTASYSDVFNFDSTKTYVYTVSAFDFSNNESVLSNSVTVTPPASTDGGGGDTGGGGGGGGNTGGSICTVLSTSGGVRAFPGAMGGGAGAVGGRGGAVIEVTNLNDSGVGSLRACVNASGPRTCVFKVGGTINLTSSLVVNNPYLTVAGQTAPGGGILISGKNKPSGAVITIFTHDVIWRYTRIRNGANSSCTGECGGNFMAYGNNIIADHNSATWNVDEGMSSFTWDTSVKNITFSQNLIAEGLLGHATSLLVSANAPASADGQTNVDIHHNVMMNNTHRAPLLRDKSTRLVNNIIYNHQAHSTQLGNGIIADVINSIYKKGPIYSGNHEINVHDAPTTDPTGIGATGDPSVYLSGNIGWNQTNPSGDQWLLANENTCDNCNDIGPVRSAWRRTTPMTNTAFPIIAEPAANLEANLIPTVGASRRLACDGSWVANRDSVDMRLINQYNTNTGNNFIPSSETQVGGFPTILAGTPCADSDHDGMPDVWETAKGLNPNNASDRNNTASNGYTNVENYLNGDCVERATTP